MTSTITKRTQGRIELDLHAMLDYAITQAVGMVQRRSAKGIGSNASPVAPYSASYQRELAKAGESTAVDFTRTGGYLGSIGERSRTVTDTKASATYGPDAGVSTPGGPPHNLRGAWFEQGTKREPPRPHLALTADERKRLADKLVRLKTR